MLLRGKQVHEDGCEPAGTGPGTALSATGTWITPGRADGEGVEQKSRWPRLHRPLHLLVEEQPERRFSSAHLLLSESVVRSCVNIPQRSMGSSCLEFLPQLTL